jgi:hypothetical protein
MGFIYFFPILNIVQLTSISSGLLQGRGHLVRASGLMELNFIYESQLKNGIQTR